MPKSARRSVKKAVSKSAIVECPHCHQRVIPSQAGVCPSCSQLMNAISQDRSREPSIIDLWTPRQIAILTFFTGFPSGFVLSSINWIRMGQTTTAAIHLTVGLILLIGWGFLLGTATLAGFVLITLGLNLGIIIYLYLRVKQSIERFAREGAEIQDATWRSGCLTGFAATFVFLLLLLLIIQILLAGQ